LLGRVAPDVVPALRGYPWYGGGVDVALPLACDGMALKLLANAVRLEMRTKCVSVASLSGRVVLERELNRMVRATRNKASVLFSVASVHIDHLVRTYAGHGLVIVCDRQGGREHYGALLRSLFEETGGGDFEVSSETPKRSEYRLRRSGCPPVRIIFTEKAEAQSLPVALASMLSKYLREVLMHRFNEYWKSHLPDLAPTAGYYNDGERFLRDIERKRAELGIAREQLVRCR
jgi:hypothetical protein